MSWITRVSGNIARRVLAREYLQARTDAWERGTFDNATRMDPVIVDFRGQDEADDVALWLAFMAGSDWEREHRGRRYEDELTSVAG